MKMILPILRLPGFQASRLASLREGAQPGHAVNHPGNRIRPIHSSTLWQKIAPSLKYRFPPAS